MDLSPDNIKYFSTSGTLGANDFYCAFNGNMAATFTLPTATVLAPAYETGQIGAIVYATSATGIVSSKTVNVIASGYYYFDGSVWKKFNSSTAGKNHGSFRVLPPSLL